MALEPEQYLNVAVTQPHSDPGACRRGRRGVLVLWVLGAGPQVASVGLGAYPGNISGSVFPRTPSEVTARSWGIPELGPAVPHHVRRPQGRVRAMATCDGHSKRDQPTGEWEEKRNPVVRLGLKEAYFRFFDFASKAVGSRAPDPAILI